MHKILEKLRMKRQEIQAVKGKKGFTLIELLVVIGILAILVLLAAPSFLGYTKDANVATMQADAKVLSNAALIYNIENDTAWPATEVEVETGETGAIGDLYEIDKDALKSHVQTLKGDWDDYAISTSGDDEGTVYHKTGVEDKEGTTHYSVVKSGS